MALNPMMLAEALKTMAPAKPMSPADYPGSYLWNKGLNSAPEVHAAKLAHAGGMIRPPGLPHIAQAVIPKIRPL